MPSVYGCCSGQTAATTPAPTLTAVSWSSASLGASALWRTGLSNYDAPLYSYNSASSQNVSDQQLNITINLNGGSGYTAGNSITQFRIGFTGSRVRPRFTGDVTGNNSIIELDQLGSSLTIPTIDGNGDITFDILPYIIALGPDSTNVITWDNPQGVGTFATTITFTCLDDLGTSKTFTTTIAEAPEIPQNGPTVVSPVMTAVMATTQGSVTSTSSGGGAFNNSIPMSFGGGQPITDYALTISLAFDNITYQGMKYDGSPNTLGQFILIVAPILGPNWVWEASLGSPTRLEVGDFGIDLPLFNTSPTTTSYNVTQFLIDAGAIFPENGLFEFPDPFSGNNFTLSVQPTEVQNIYGVNQTIDPIVISPSPLIP